MQALCTQDPPLLLHYHPILSLDIPRPDPELFLSSLSSERELLIDPLSTFLIIATSPSGELLFRDFKIIWSQIVNTLLQANC